MIITAEKSKEIAIKLDIDRMNKALAADTVQMQGEGGYKGDNMNWIDANTNKPEVSNKDYLCFYNGHYVMARFTDTIHYIANYDNNMMDYKTINPSWVYGGTHIIEPTHYFELTEPSLDDDCFLMRIPTL